MEKIRLDPETSALILIDLQHGIVALETSPHPASSVVAKAASLAATFRKHSSPVIYVRVDLAPICCRFSPIALTVIPGIRRPQSLRNWFLPPECSRATSSLPSAIGVHFLEP